MANLPAVTVNPHRNPPPDDLTQVNETILPAVYEMGAHK